MHTHTHIHTPAQTHYPARPPSFSLPFTPGLGDEDLKLLQERLDEVLRDLYPHANLDTEEEEGIGGLVCVCM